MTSTFLGTNLVSKKTRSERKKIISNKNVDPCINQNILSML